MTLKLMESKFEFVLLHLMILILLNNSFRMYMYQSINYIRYRIQSAKVDGQLHLDKEAYLIVVWYVPFMLLLSIFF